MQSHSLPARSQCVVGTTLGFALLFAIAAGCDDGRMKRVPVSGQVLIDGKPLTYGDILFVPQEGRTSRGKLDQEGRFKLSCYENEDGAVLGTHRISIRAIEVIDFAHTRWHAPQKYTNYQTSGLSQEIKGPTEDLVINISWEGKQPFVQFDESATDSSGRYGKQSK